jgi:G3E family GTPase
MEENNYSSVYFMNKKLEKDYLIHLANQLFHTEEYGNIIRIKGFFKAEDKWYLMNLTKDTYDIDEISAGQDVIILIGENLKEEEIKDLIENKF